MRYRPSFHMFRELHRQPYRTWFGSRQTERCTAHRPQQRKHLPFRRRSHQIFPAEALHSWRKRQTGHPNNENKKWQYFFLFHPLVCLIDQFVLFRCLPDKDIGNNKKDKDESEEIPAGILLFKCGNIVICTMDQHGDDELKDRKQN